MTTEMTTTVPVQPIVRSSTSIEAILSQAVQAGRTGAELKELLDVFERLKAHEAKTAFLIAMAACKAAMPPVKRTHENRQFEVTRNGVKRYSTYAGESDLAAAIDPVAPLHGLSYGWTDETIDDKGIMRLACVVSHVGGHSTSTSASGPVESKAGCSPLQKYGTCATYLRRRSLANAFGLTSVEDDVDGNDPVASEPRADAARITAKGIADIRGLIESTKTAPETFLKVFKVARIEDLTAAQYAKAMALFDQKIAAIAKAKAVQPKEDK